MTQIPADRQGGDAAAGGRPPAGGPALPRAVQLLVVALMAVALAVLATGAPAPLPVTIGAGALMAVALGLGLRGLWRQARAAVLRHAARALVLAEEEAAYLADAAGAVLHRNRAAHDRQAGRLITALPEVLADIYANPAAFVAQLQSRADLSQTAREEVLTRRGPLRISVARLDRGIYLWRLMAGDGAGARARGADALSLPMLTAGPSGTILFMNPAFRRLTGERARVLADVFVDLPLHSGRIHAVNTVEGVLDCLVAEVPGSGGRREVYLLPGSGWSGAAGTDWHGVEDLPVPMLKIAPDGVILAANREVRALLPMPFGPGTRLSDLIEGLGRPVGDWVRETAEGRGSGTAQFLRGTGAHQDLFLRVSLSPGGEGEDRHIVAVLHDVTEFKTLEAQFVQSQKMQAIGQLAGGVAHDFNNLLTAISGHCDLLILRHDETDPDFPDLVQIRQNANRAAALVGQLLAFSRKQSLIPEVLDLRDTLSDLTHLLNRLVGERVRLTLDHDPDLRPIRADKRQLEQVLMNLVVNARDAMPEGGTIRIETGNLRLIEALHRDRATLAPGDYVVLRVIDVGTGMPPERLPKIFEPFYTTKRPGEGTGLGLSTAYGIVKQTGGYIFVDSTPGEGTTFTLYFPACSAQEAASAAAAALAGSGGAALAGAGGAAAPGAPPAARSSGPAPGRAKPAAGAGEGADARADSGAESGAGSGAASGADAPQASEPGQASDPVLDPLIAAVLAAPAPASGPSPAPVSPAAAPAPARGPGEGVILLVEDEAPVRAFASRALRLRGYTVVEADSAEAALALLADPALAVDVFVTDVIMPGKDGPTWVREALEDRPQTRVIFVSGYAEDAFAEQKALIPNSVFLPKPFSLVDLTATVQGQLH